MCLSLLIVIKHDRLPMPYGRAKRYPVSQGSFTRQLAANSAGVRLTIALCERGYVCGKLIHRLRMLQAGAPTRPICQLGTWLFLRLKTQSKPCRPLTTNSPPNRARNTMPIESFCFIAIAVAVGALIQGTTGMGFALVVAPMMGLLEPALLPISLLILMLPLNVIIAWQEREAIDLRGSSWITLGRFFGTFGGVWILFWLSLPQLKLLIGLSTIAACLVTGWPPRSSRVAVHSSRRG